MALHVVLLRGINIGASNRISMPELRTALEGNGFSGARTYLQSGNIVLASDDSPEVVAGTVQELVARHFALAIPVVVRSGEELAAVVGRNPLADVATNPKTYQVSFLATELPTPVVAALGATAVSDERVVVIGREIYAWHPEGIARSKLWTLLAGPKLGVVATARNWTTVTAIAAMAASSPVPRGGLWV